MNQDSENQPEIRNVESEPRSWDSELIGGQASAEEQSEVMDWLTRHPEESARLPDLQDLVRLCQQTSPAEPSKEAWNDLTAGVMAEMTNSAQRISQSRAESVNPKTRDAQRWLRSGLLGAAAAAAIVLALVIRQEKTPDASLTGPLPLPDPNGEAQLDRGELPIIDSNDVDLVSMEGNDSTLLVVGNPPLSEALVLMKAGDVTIGETDPDVKFHMASDPDSSPMIVVPIRSKESKDPDSK